MDNFHEVLGASVELLGEGGTLVVVADGFQIQKAAGSTESLGAAIDETISCRGLRLVGRTEAAYVVQNNAPPGDYSVQVCYAAAYKR